MAARRGHSARGLDRKLPDPEQGLRGGGETLRLGHCCWDLLSFLGHSPVPGMGATDHPSAIAGNARANTSVRAAVPPRMTV